MFFTFEKNDKQTKKPVNRFLQDGASAVYVSADPYCNKSLPNAREMDFSKFEISILYRLYAPNLMHAI